MYGTQNKPCTYTACDYSASAVVTAYCRLFKVGKFCGCGTQL